MLNDIWQWLIGADTGKFASGDGASWGFTTYGGGVTLGLIVVFIGLLFLVEPERRGQIEGVLQNFPGEIIPFPFDFEGLMVERRR